jgi:hypothetical protein
VYIWTSSCKSGSTTTEGKRKGERKEKIKGDEKAIEGTRRSRQKADPEDGGDMFLRIIGIYLNYTALQPRTLYSLWRMGEWMYRATYS